MNKQIFITASKAYNWEEGYDEAFPYKLSVGQFDHQSASTWTVGTATVEFEVPTAEHIVSCQVNGLEETLLELATNYHKAKANLEEQLDELKCISYQPALNED